jgi:hypothetical protein
MQERKRRGAGSGTTILNLDFGFEELHIARCRSGS